LKDKLLKAGKSNFHYMELMEKLQQGILPQKNQDYKLGIDEILMYRRKFCVPNSQELKNMILKEMHNVSYVGHPTYQKTIAVVKSQYYWLGMNKEIVEYTAKCLECQKVKAEINRHPFGLQQPLPIPEWKWEVAIMDFITKLPKTSKQHDSIMVVVDKLTKSSYFIPMKLTHKETKIVDIYMREISRFHGIPKIIVSDRDPKFTSNF
jgi:hypothetical protein